MSSKFVRDSVSQYLKSNLPDVIFADIDGVYSDFDEFRDEFHIGLDDGFVGLSFYADSDETISIGGGGHDNCYEERGHVRLHVVERAQLGCATKIIEQCEQLTTLVRNVRINKSLLTEEVTPVSFNVANTIEFEQGYSAGVLIFGYSYRHN